MAGGKEILGCLGALAGIVGIFLAITISFTFYLIPIAFFLFLGSLLVISSALGPGPGRPKPPADAPSPPEEHRPGKETPEGKK